jgi:predicted TIM-barrel fold metal-dependent hydrolase
MAASAAALAMAPGNQQVLMAQRSDHPSIVDAHVHVWKRDPAYPFAAETKDAPREDALPDTLLRLMHAHGVDHTVIVHVIYYRWDCRYTAAVLRQYPQRFLGVCRVDPQSPQAAEDLAVWVRAGFHGVRLSPSAGAEGDWIGDQRQMDSIATRAAALGIPLCILCPTARLADVQHLIARHQDRLDICIDHMADCPIDRPDELKKLLALAAYRRVYIKLSHLWSLSRQEYPYRDTHDQVRRLYDAFGPDRLMWGSDWPLVERYCGYGRALALYREEIEFLSDDDRRWILGGTARRLWPFA